MQILAQFDGTNNMIIKTVYLTACNYATICTLNEIDEMRTRTHATNFYEQ